jgi:hypothetical protein
MMRHIDPVDQCTLICITIHDLETTSNRWILDEFGSRESVAKPKLYYYICDESLIFMNYLGSPVVGYKQSSTYDFNMKDPGMTL